MSESAHGQTAAVTTSQTALDLIFNPEGKKMVPFFHVMISYRVSTEGQLARKMFDRLLLNSFKRIPEVGLSQWPDGFEKKPPGDANVFLDQVCLKSGENWKHSDEGGGFVGALLKSLIFVPLLSWKVEREKKDDPESKMMFKGSVGEMVARYSGRLNTYIDPNSVTFCDAKDNVLLELILAMELSAHLKRIHKSASCIHPCLRLFPVIVDDFPDLSKLPDKVSELTYADASMYLEKCGIRIQDKDKKTVRGVVEHFCTVQAVKFKDLGREDLALDSLSSKIISAVSELVSKIDPLSLFESKPLCAELHSFLSKRNCSYMTRILAANNITSLRQLSFLTHQNAIYDLSKLCSAVSSKSAIAELTTLTRVIEESKQVKESWLLSVRLNRFVDRNVSFETVIKSSSGVLISCAQKSWLTMYFFLGLAALVAGVASLVSNGPGANTIFDFAASAFFLSVPPAAVFHSPKRAYYVFCSMWPTFAVSVSAGFCIDFIKNGSFSIDNAVKCSAMGSQLQTSFRACAIAQIICGPLLLFCMVLVCWYVCFQRQDLAWNTFLYLCFIYVATDIVFEVRVLGNSAASPVLSYAMLFGVICLFVLTELMNKRAHRKARDGVSEDEKMYQDRWNALREDEHEKPALLILNSQSNSNSKLNLKAFDDALKSAGSVEVLQDCNDIDALYARAEFINDAFQSLVLVLLETGLSANPAAETKAAVEVNVAAQAEPASEAKVAAEAGAAAEAKAASKAKLAPESGVDHHGSSNISRLKKDLEAFVAEVDIEEILKNLKLHHEATMNHLKPHNVDKTASHRTKEGNGSAKAATEPSEQLSEGPQLPGTPIDTEHDVQPVKQAHVDDTRVDIGSPGGNSVATAAQDQNETARQLTKDLDGSVQTTQQSSGAGPDGANKDKDRAAARSFANEPAVLVRRGPVKLPARAIAKVSPPLSSCTPQAAINASNADV
jgi:hypothetical protein